MTPMEIELAARKAVGNHPLSLSQISASLEKIGYLLDRSLDCSGLTKIMTGSRAGAQYPSTTTGVVEIDTGRSAFHCEARRDGNFEKLQMLRFEETYAVVQGRIFSF